MENFSASLLEAVTCPACGLLCDDICIERDSAGQLKMRDKGCAKSVTFFERTPQTSSPSINGKPATLNEAIKAAANILQNANQPLFAGLGTEVQGMRSALSLADKVGASLDHMNAYSSFRNTLVLQNSGWQVTTLTEVRNRVDLLLIIGTDIVSHNPRFFERNIWNEESMFGQDTNSREIVYLGGRSIETARRHFTQRQKTNCATLRSSTLTRSCRSYGPLSMEKTYRKTKSQELKLQICKA
jgi:formylmethanofuran dehydrogenase subunit B